MKTQELKIEAPEGYEVDWENSSMNTIRFKPIKNKITYKDVCRELFLDRPSWRLPDSGVPVQSTCTLSANIHHSTISTSNRQLEQLLALNKLMNVAKYLNGDWKPDFTSINQYKYMYIYDHLTSKIEVQYNIYRTYLTVCFKSKELALQAIEILGEEEVKKALGVFE